MKQSCRACQGFTLVEVMVALVIISIAIVTLLATHAGSTRSYAEAKATIIGSLLAQQKLAELRTAEYPEPFEDSGTFEGNDSYQWTLSVKETDIEELREVILEVSLASNEDIEEAPTLGSVKVLTYLADMEEEEEEEVGEEELFIN